MLREMLAASKRTVADQLARLKKKDWTPVEVTPRLSRPVSTLDDLRRMMLQIQKEHRDAETETFEEFYDFGDDADFEDIPAPAQSKAEAIQASRDRNFELELETQRQAYEDRVKKKAKDRLRQEMLEEGDPATGKTPADEE